MFLSKANFCDCQRSLKFEDFGYQLKLPYEVKWRLEKITQITHYSLVLNTELLHYTFNAFRRTFYSSSLKYLFKFALNFTLFLSLWLI